MRRNPQRVYPWACAALAALCFANTLGNGFCDDDLPIVVGNTLVTEPGQWGRLWLKDYWHADPHATPYRDLLYRPLAILSYRLNHTVGGLDPWGYHLVNLALHALVTLLVYRLARRLTGSTRAALVAGSFFAVLPIHTEAIDNVVGRAELLAAAFSLLALELFARSRRWPALIGGSLCALAACCSKESGLTVLLLVPLLGWYERAAGPRPAEAKAGARRPPIALDALRLALALALPMVVYLTLRYVALGGALYQPVTLTKTINVLADASSWQRVCGAFQLWGLYWAKTVWPRVLCLDYSILTVAPANSLFKGHALLGLGALVLPIAWSVTQWRRGRRLPAVLTVALLACYFPTSNTLVLIKTYFAERIWYLPSIWVTVIAGQLLSGAWSKRAEPGCASRLSVARPLVVGLVTIAVMAGLLRCWVRNTEWRNEGTLYAATYRDHPNAIRALLSYGEWLTLNDRYEEGIALMKRALQIDLGFTDAHRLLGAAYLRGRDMHEAFEHLQTADVQIPGHPWTRRLLDKAQQAVETEAGDRLVQAQRTVDDNPNDLEALIRLADELAAVGKLEEAADRLADAEARFADSPAFQHRLAVALVMANRRDQGVSHYRRASELAPENAILLVELAMLLLDRRSDGDLAEARTFADRAHALTPNGLQVRLCRAELFALDNHPAEAATLFRSIAADLPDNSKLKQTCLLRAEWLER